jgi:hypothetical protein
MFADGVVDDPEYNALLEEIGFGATWRSYLEARVSEMAPIAGIGLSDSGHDSL